MQWDGSASSVKTSHDSRTFLLEGARLVRDLTEHKASDIRASQDYEAAITKAVGCLVDLCYEQAVCQLVSNDMLVRAPALFGFSARDGAHLTK
eukprot:CAMPEP_0117603866 /NCGR_PEP_ID=MMETSP0784-20121206/78384_1 /TAXON_ID=39447 /ORGANISM="" /LENGTH=92 /DNA_ID=CAMNT_0005406863 /DNA_START=1 /DNA_END=279 /DNA_ORIENTATION=-